MKIYCGVPFLGIHQFSDNYKKLYQYVVELGYEHVDEEFLKIDQTDWLKKMTQSKKAHAQHFETKMQSVRKADICIFEASFHSLGIGFLIQKTLDDGKPCIVLYSKDSIPIFLSGARHEKLIVKQYIDSTLKKVLKSALTTAKERRDKRFNFYLSTKLLEYIELLSKEEGSTKSKVMRDIILRNMRERGSYPLDFE